MFLLDSLMISGIRWTLETVLTAAEAERNDDSALRDRLLEAELQREMGEMSDDEFAAIESDLLAKIREIKTRRDGGGGAFGGAQPLEAGDGRFQIEAEMSGDFYGAPDMHAQTDVITITPEAVTEAVVTHPERSNRSKRSNRSNRSGSDRSVASQSGRTKTTAAARTRTIRTPRTK